MANNKTITGKLTYIAKTDGIHLDNKELWYNPIAGLKVDAQLLNKEVILSMTDKSFVFSDIKQSAGQISGVSSTPNMNTADKKDILIAREVAIKCATDLCCASLKDDGNEVDIYATAKKIEDWILRN